MGMVVEHDMDSGHITVHAGYNRALTFSDSEARTLTKFLLNALYGGRHHEKAELQAQVSQAYALEPKERARLQAVA